jgi:hypothetical protein
MVYAHFDIEADGPSPFENNMLSIGVVFTDQSGKELANFLGDLKPLSGHVEDTSTMEEFWYANENNKTELERIRKNAKPAMEVMKKLHDIIQKFNVKKIVWVARPSAFDWQWLNYYHNMYLTIDPKANLAGKNSKRQAFKATCVSTMRDIYQIQFGVGRKEMESKEKEWGGDFSMTHNPLDDCRYQAKLYHNLFQELANNKKQ